MRTAVGLFDVTHMGDIQLRGPGSLAAIQHISMNDASKLAIGQAHYSAMLYPNGTFVDDVVVHKLSDNDYLIVINAGTREKDIQWVRQKSATCPGVHITDLLRLLHPARHPGPTRRRDAAEADQRRPDGDQELLVHLGPRSADCAIHADRPHRLHRRGRLRDLHPLRRGHQRARVERGARGGPGVRHHALRPGRAQHAAPGVGDGALRPRDLRRASTSSRPVWAATRKLDKGPASSVATRCSPFRRPERRVRSAN